MITKLAHYVFFWVPLLESVIQLFFFCCASWPFAMKAGPFLTQFEQRQFHDSRIAILRFRRRTELQDDALFVEPEAPSLDDSLHFSRTVRYLFWLVPSNAAT